jgi:large subunit ribosomal protein L21
MRRVHGKEKIGELKMKYAIVESGGKQYKAVEGSMIEVDLLSNASGEKVVLETVLLLVDGETISIGTPAIKGARIETTVVEHFKGPKLVIFKYRPKKRIRTKTGHRQQYTRLKVDSIVVE